MFLQESCQRQGLEVGESLQIFSPLDISAQSAILGLGESMVERGTVPQTASSRHHLTTQSSYNPHLNRSRDTLVRDIKKIEDNVMFSITLRDREVKDSEDQKRTRKELEQKLYFCKVEKNVEKLAKPQLVCQDIACVVELKDDRGDVMLVYQAVCHDDCRDELSIQGGL